MKNKFILTIFTITILFGCSKEEIDNDLNSVNSENLNNLELKNSSNENLNIIDSERQEIDLIKVKEGNSTPLNTDSLNNSLDLFGNEDGFFPFTNFDNLECGTWNPPLYLSSTDPQALGFRVYRINYDSFSVTTQQQANCIRQEFFIHNPNLQLLVDNDGDFRTEFWVDITAPLPFGVFSLGTDGATTQEKADNDPRASASER